MVAEVLLGSAARQSDEPQHPAGFDNPVRPARTVTDWIGSFMSTSCAIPGRITLILLKWNLMAVEPHPGDLLQSAIAEAVPVLEEL